MAILDHEWINPGPTFVNVSTAISFHDLNPDANLTCTNMKAAAKASSQSQKSGAADDEDIDPTVRINYSLPHCIAYYSFFMSFTYSCLFSLAYWKQYFQNRLKYLEAQKTDGKNPYPHKFEVSMSITEYIDQYGGLNNGEHLEDVAIALAGTYHGVFFLWEK